MSISICTALIKTVLEDLQHSTLKSKDSGKGRGQRGQPRPGPDPQGQCRPSSVCGGRQEGPARLAPPHSPVPGQGSSQRRRDLKYRAQGCIPEGSGGGRTLSSLYHSWCPGRSVMVILLLKTGKYKSWIEHLSAGCWSRVRCTLASNLYIRR